MGKADTKGKEYLKDNRRFADVCNVALFDGEQVIQPECLEEKDATEVLSVFGTDMKEVQQQKWRDLLKNTVIKTDGKHTFVLLGIENQSEIHYAMPVKNLIYDALNYGTQVNEAAKKHRREKTFGTRAEFLSGFQKKDRLTPIVTITVYWGTEDWDGPMALREMFEETVDERLMRYIPDYELALLSPGTVRDFRKFNTSLGAVLELIKKSENKQEFWDYVTTNPRFKAMDNESVSAINVFTRINIPINEKEGVTDMCKAMQELQEDFIEQGIERGIEQGIKQGIDQERAAQIRKMLNRGKTPEQISEFCGYALEEIRSVQQDVLQTV